MSPTKVYHAAFQGEIEYLLRSILTNGKTFPECAILTAKGIKVADVIWVSKNRFKQIKTEVACSIAPEICIEVMFLSNSMLEMNEKKHLYFEAGAEEFWLCDETGNVKFYNKHGCLEYSNLATKFPSKVEL
ncbi:MAG: Uma2 family endonuclease [Thiomargarita sp.]|nr:Uma2 family endonuclease [Thiomargarita sp.]